MRTNATQYHFQGGSIINTIKAIIEYIPSDYDGINYAETVATLTTSGNNISNSGALNVPYSGGIRPFILGVSKLGATEQGGDGHHFWGDPDKGVFQRDNSGRQIGGLYNGYWSLNWSDANGMLNPPTTLTIIGSNISHFIIRFDEYLREWASVINVDGLDYANNTEAFVWSGIISDHHTVQIKKWSAAGKQVKITSILIGLIIEYDRTKINRLTAGSRNTFDNTKPYSGVTPQYGNIELVDTDNNLLELAQMDLLRAGLPVKIYLNAPEDITAESDLTPYMLGHYTTGKCNYSYGDMIVAVELQDNILAWNDIFFSGIPNNENNSAYTFFMGLKDQTPDNININNDVEDFLKDISLPDGYLSTSDLTTAWNTFCAATGTKIRKDTVGDIWLTI